MVKELHQQSSETVFRLKNQLGEMELGEKERFWAE